MPQPLSSTILLQQKLDEIRAGHDDAAEALMSHAYERLRKLARKMLANYPAVHRWEQTDDVLQNAAMRLNRAVKQVQPESVRAFFGLAALQIRRVLIDLARHYGGPQGQGAHHATAAAAPSATRSDLINRQPAPDDEPLTLAQWQEFHELAGKLPQPEREVFDQMWYHGLSQTEVASVLEISLRTVNRRWQSARLKLYDAMQGQSPDQ